MSSNVSLNPVHPGGNVEVRSVAVGHRATAFWHTMIREEGRHGGHWRGAYWLRDRPHVGQSQNIFGSGRDQRPKLQKRAKPCRTVWHRTDQAQQKLPVMAA